MKITELLSEWFISDLILIICEYSYEIRYNNGTDPDFSLILPGNNSVQYILDSKCKYIRNNVSKWISRFLDLEFSLYYKDSKIKTLQLQSVDLEFDLNRINGCDFITDFYETFICQITGEDNWTEMILNYSSEFLEFGKYSKFPNLHNSFESLCKLFYFIRIKDLYFDIKDFRNLPTTVYPGNFPNGYLLKYKDTVIDSRFVQIKIV